MGIRLGKKYTAALDFDLAHLPIKYQSYLQKRLIALFAKVNSFYVKTRKGFHLYLLTKNLLTNKAIYWTDFAGKMWVIGSIQSKGKYVASFESPPKRTSYSKIFIL